MKKILIINTGTYFVNGISNVITTYLRYLDFTSLSVYVTSYGDIDPIYKKMFEEKNISIIDVPHRKNELFAYYKKIKKIMKQYKIDTVHIHGNSGTMYLEVKAAKKTKIPNIIVQAHNSSCSIPSLFGHNSMFAKKICKDSTCRIAISKLVGDWLFGKDYLILNNAIDIQKFIYNSNIRNEIRKKYEISEDSFVIGHFGCFNKQKNQIFLIDIFEEYLKIDSNSYLILGGDGTNFEIVKNAIISKRLQDKILLIGKIDNTYDFYNAFDIFVLPSLWEGLGIVNIEAQSNGLPCLVSNVVASDANVSDRFFVENISSTANKWAIKINEIRKMCIARQSNMVPMITEHGYSILNEVKKLQKIYGGQ